jgi:LAO/AO transport system kinase
MDDAGMIPGVFIRSMGTRGSMGGLARSTREVAMAMDAFGKDRVVIETVGVGQSELDIAGAADTTVVVLVPESGDGVQAMKAGLMEIADIIVLNKSDREGADKIAREIRAILELKPREEGDWDVPVIPTIARDNKGIDEVITVVDEHKAFIESSGIGRVRRRARVRSELSELLERDIIDIVMNANGLDKSIEGAIERIIERKSTPYNECEEIINKLDIR